MGFIMQMQLRIVLFVQDKFPMWDNNVYSYLKKAGLSFHIWTVKRLKPAFFQMTSRGQFQRSPKDLLLYRSLWENNPQHTCSVTLVNIFLMHLCFMSYWIQHAVHFIIYDADLQRQQACNFSRFSHSDAPSSCDVCFQRAPAAIATATSQLTNTSRGLHPSFICSLCVNFTHALLHPTWTIQKSEPPYVAVQQ